MSIDFFYSGSECFLRYTPSEQTSIKAYYLSCIKKYKKFRLKNSFFFSGNDFYSCNEEDNVITFKLGLIRNHYLMLNKLVLDVSRDYYFSIDIELSQRFFVGINSTSIIKKLDSFLPKNVESVYIDPDKTDISPNEEEGCVHISFSLFKKFIDNIPKRTEVDNYISTRYSSVFNELFPFELDRIKNKHNKYLRKKRENILSFLKTKKDFQESRIDLLYDFDLLKLKSIKEYLAFLVDNPYSVPESVFQRYIAKIICLIFPKYLHAVREVSLKGIDLYEKRPDFLLIDHQGFIDVLEIKKPDFCLLKEKKFRNNYISSNDLSSTVQQTEKYVLCLNHFAESFEKNPPKIIQSRLSQGLLNAIHVNNPLGFIIAGRDKDFNEQQVNDLELIRRQFRNIVDIITYDDLLKRLDNSIFQFGSPNNIVVDN